MRELKGAFYRAAAPGSVRGEFYFTNAVPFPTLAHNFSLKSQRRMAHVFNIPGLCAVGEGRFYLFDRKKIEQTVLKPVGPLRMQ